MIFTEPLPFRQALESRQVRALLPTALGSDELKAIPAALRERAMFSARVTNADFLQEAADLVESILNPQRVLRPLTASERAAGIRSAELTGRSLPAEGKLVTEGMDVPTARLQLKQFLTKIGYSPAPEDAGTIKDLRTDRRLNLILKTNTEMAQGFGYWQQGQQEGALEAFPAQELYRAEDREKKREWRARWEGAGGRFFGGRMIAAKDDAVWQEIANAEDGLGNPYPPFAFGSGMDVRDIARSEAIELGVITEDTTVEAQPRDFNDLLQATPNVRETALRDALMSDLGAGYEFSGEVLRKTI